MTQTDYTSEYLPTFTYTSDDVAANRQGVLTQDQLYLVEAVYQARQRMTRQTYRLFAVWLVVLLIIGFVIELRQSDKSLGAFLPQALPIMAIAVIGIGGIMLVSGVVTNMIGRDARDKRISIAEGKARVIEQKASYKRRNYMRYELRLNGQLFRFANHASIAHFEEDKYYRVYYIKFYPFPLMLSAEMT